MRKVFRLRATLMGGFALIVAFATVATPLSSSKVFAAGPVTYVSTKTIDTDGFIYVVDVATDSTGAVYEAGSFSGTATFDGAGGTDTQTSVNNSSFLTKHNANGSYAWTKIIDTSTLGAYATGNTVAVDPSGNVYLGGQVYGTVTFDGVGGTDTQTSAGAAFITKFTSSGAYVWTNTQDTSAGGSQTANIQFDKQGDLYAVGIFSNTVVFDGIGGTDSQTSVNSDSYMTKYNADGSYAYTKIADATNAANLTTSGVSIDSNGNAYVLGNFSGTVVFDGPGGTDSQTSGNGSAYLTKYNPDGSYGWTKTYDTSNGGYMSGSGVAVDAAGNVYVTGFFDGQVVFDPSATLNSSNSTSFLTKYNASGTYVSTKYFDTSNGNADAVKVATDLLGNVYIFSGFNGTVVFDGMGGTDSQTTTSGNGALTKYNANGSYVWTKTLDTTNGSAVIAQGAIGGLAVDKLGNAYFASFYSGTVVFDGMGGTDSQAATGSTGGFLTKYTAFDPTDPAITGLSQQTNSGVSTSTPGVPNTGFGESPSKAPVLVIAIVTLPIALVGFVGALVIYLRSRKSN